MKRGINLYRGSKRGWIDVTIIFIVVLFTLGIFSLVGYNMFSELNSELQSDPDIHQDAKDNAAASYSRYPSTMDSLFLTLFVLGFIAVVIITWLSFENPLFIFILFVLMISLLIVGAIMSNTWAELVTDEDIGSLSSGLPFTTHILNNFVMYVLGTMASMGAVLFMRSRF